MGRGCSSASLTAFLVKLDAAGLGRVQIQGVRQVPGDGFSLAVRVGCQIDAGRVFGFLFDPRQNVAPTPNGDVFHFKIMVRVHTQLRFGQIAHMALRGLHVITLAQKFFNRLGLRGRFHDHQFLCSRRHLTPPLIDYSVRRKRLPVSRQIRPMTSSVPSSASSCVPSSLSRSPSACAPSASTASRARMRC